MFTIVVCVVVRSVNVQNSMGFVKFRKELNVCGGDVLQKVQCFCLESDYMLLSNS